MTGHSVHSLPSDGTLIELLHKRAHEQPDLPAYVSLKDGLTADRTLSYRELDQRARAIAVYLRQRFQSGDRLLLMHPPGLEFVEAFWGCLYAGMVAIPVPPPDAFRVKQSGRRLTAIAQDARSCRCADRAGNNDSVQRVRIGGIVRPTGFMDSQRQHRFPGSRSWTCPSRHARDVAYL